MNQFRRKLHIRRWLAAFILAVLLVLPSGDRLHITPALEVASEHAFSLVQWHITNFLGKWAHLVREAIPGQKPLRDERLAIIDEYLQTSRLAAKEERLIEGRIARAGGANSAKGAVISREYLDELLALQRSLRPKAEEAVESELSAVLLGEGFGWWGNLLFPPVDIRFGHLPDDHRDLAPGQDRAGRTPTAPYPNSNTSSAAGWRTSSSKNTTSRPSWATWPDCRRIRRW